MAGGRRKRAPGRAPRPRTAQAAPSPDADARALSAPASPLAPHIQMRMGRELFVGPMPHPEHYEHYERAYPGSAERILSMAERQLSIAERTVVLAEKQQEHRQQMESTVLNADNVRSNKGMNYAFILMLTGLLSGLAITVFSLAQHEFIDAVIGALFDSVDLVAMASVFVYSTQNRRNEREGRMAQLARIFGRREDARHR